MAFKMCCPKCNGVSYNIERDRRTATQKDEWASLIFSCRCGKMLFGAQIKEEYDRQEREHQEAVNDRDTREAERRAREEEERRREEQLKAAFEYRAQYLREKRAREAEEERRRKAEADRRWREKVKATLGHEPAVAPPSLEPEPVPEPVRRPPPAAKKKKPRPAPAKKRAAPPPAAKKPEPAPPRVAIDPMSLLPDDLEDDILEAVKAGELEVGVPDGAIPDGFEKCYWPPCKKAKRPGSKYCSRNCSNKNARWRHKHRKRREKAAADRDSEAA